jgi:hypothetical protein
MIVSVVVMNHGGGFFFAVDLCDKLCGDLAIGFAAAEFKCS